VFGVGQRRPVRVYGVPLFVSALALTLYARVDLLALKALGGTRDEAGFYGAAQNLSMLANLVAMSLTPVLLSTLGRLLSRGESAAAREIGRNAMRVVVALLPVAAAVAGAAGELATVFFGRDFEPTAHVLAPLIFGSFATIMIQVATTIFTADGRPNGALRLTLALVPLAIAGHLLMIPRFGASGAATVTAAVGLLGSLWAVWNVHRLWRIVPPPGTLLRSVVIGGAAFALAALWPTPGLLVFAKLAVIGGLCVLLFRALGELNAEELAKTRAWLTKSEAAATGSSLG
jgi:O-antigen/teichoic acid export membrane protein